MLSQRNGYRLYVLSLRVHVNGRWWVSFSSLNAWTFRSSWRIACRSSPILHNYAGDRFSMGFRMSHYLNLPILRSENRFGSVGANGVANFLFIAVC